MSSKKAIQLLCIAHCGSLYGANRSLLDLLTSLNREEIAPEVVFLEEGPAVGLFQQRGIAIHLFPGGLSSHQSGGSQGRWKYDARPYTAKWYLRSLHRYVTDATRSFKLARKFWARRNSLIVHTNTSVTDAGLMLSKRLGCPHVWHLREYGAADFGFHPDFGRPWQSRMLAASKLCIAISEDVRRHFCAPPASNINCGLVYNGVRKRKDFAAGYEHRLSQSEENASRFHLLMASAIHQGKGHETAVLAFSRALPRLKNAQLLIAGNGGGLPHLQALVQKLGLGEHVRFLGYQEDISPHMISANSLLMCSEREAMGRVTVEAMGYGTPVIGSATGGTVELIDHGRTGLLYDGSIEDLCEKLVQFPKDQKSAAALSRACHMTALERFTIENYAASFTRLLQDEFHQP